MNLTETIKKMKDAELDESHVEVGGGATGTAKAAEPTGVRAKALGNSKAQGDLTLVKIADPNNTGVEDTDVENNTKPTGDASAKNKASIAAKGTGMKEHIDVMFEGEDLSEEFKERAGTIFEAAVSERVIEITTALEEEYEAALNSKLEEIEEQSIQDLEGLATKLDEYLNYVTEQWMEGNQIAVESALKSEITEEFIEGLKNLFAEHYIDVPNERFDVVEELSVRVQELEEKLNEVVNENIELAASINEMNTEEVFNEISESLVATQVEKFKKLTEGVECDDLSNYKKKLQIIKENYFGTTKVDKKTSGLLEESFEGEEEMPIARGPMAHYMQAISRNTAK